MQGKISAITRKTASEKPVGGNRPLQGQISKKAFSERPIDNTSAHRNQHLASKLSANSVRSDQRESGLHHLKGKISSANIGSKKIRSIERPILKSGISAAALGKSKKSTRFPLGLSPLSAAEQLRGAKQAEAISATQDKAESQEQTNHNPASAQPQCITGRKAIDVPTIFNHLREKEKIFFVNGADEECYAYDASDGVFHMLAKTRFYRFVIRSLRAEGFEDLDFIDPNTLLTVFKNLRNDPPLLLEADELSPNDHLVNFRNGYVDLDDATLQLYPHSPDLMLTSCLQAEYIPHAQPKRFLKYMDFQWPAATERERALDILSLCVSPLKRLKKILYFVGGKDCGKSQVVEVITKIVGDEFSTPFKPGDFAGKFYIEEMRGKRLMYCADVDTQTPLKQVDVIKKATGRDMLNAEPKNKARAKFRAVSVFLFAGNALPNLGVNSSDSALVDRFAILPFPHPVPIEDQIDAFGDLLFVKEGDEIASYLIDHLHGLAKRGFRITPSPSANEAIGVLRRIGPIPTLNAYIDAKLVLAPGQVVSCQEAYQDYGKWAQAHDRPIVNYSQFKNHVLARLPVVIEKARPHHARDENTVACFIGVAYADNEE